MTSRRLPVLSLAITGFCFSTLSVADLAEFNPSKFLAPYIAFPLMPRVTGLGMVGDQGEIWGDGMVPLVGDANRIWYLDAQAKTAFNSDWFGSMGTGVRAVYQDNSILGAYLFFDRNVSPDDNTFWFVSPGIEELGNLVDFRANGYFPTSSKKQYGKTDWADNFGVYDYVSFQGHNQYDILMTQDEEVGWGADAEVGGKIPGLKGTRAYLGGYHFNFSDASDINGVAARIEMPINRHLGITVRDSYDNEQHNMFLLGLKLTIGGVNIHPRDPHQAIQERILDPIERNLATLGQGVGEPVQEVLTPVPAANPVNPTPPMVERDNIWFFSPSGTSSFTGSINDCTIGNVCIDSNFNQDTINGINALKLSSPDINNFHSSSPTFYLANPGTYSALNNGMPLQLNNDWLWGRTANFAQEQQTIVTGALVINGSDNQLFNIVLQNSIVSPQTIGITLNQGSRLDIIDSIIGENPELMNAAVIEETNYATAIQLQDATLRILDDSKIYAYGFDGQLVTGIQANYSTGAQGYELKIENSEVLAKTFLSDNMQNDNKVTALNLQNAPAVTLTTARITALASAPGDLKSNNVNMATGINANNSQVTMLDTDLFATAEVGNDNEGINMAVAIGANNFLTDIRFQDNRFTITGGSINANTTITNDNIGANMSAAIGENAVSALSLVAEDIPAIGATLPIFINNTFTLDNTQLGSVSTIRQNRSVNQTAGIGGNEFGLNIDTSLINNSFTIKNNSQINSSASIRSNAGLSFVTGIGGNALGGVAKFGGDTSEEGNIIKLLTGSSITSQTNITGKTDNVISFNTAIGGNAALTDTTDASFNFNSIVLDGSEGRININSTITVNGSTSADNPSSLAAGIGGNAYSGSANFDTNKIQLNNAGVNSNSTVMLNIKANSINASVGLGGNAVQGTAIFSDNKIDVVQNSTILSSAIVNGDNLSENLSAGLGSNGLSLNSKSTASFTENTINVNTGSTLQSTSIVGTNNSGNNSGDNSTVALGTNAINILSSIAVTNFTNNTITLNDARLIASADTKGINQIQGDNIARSLGNFPLDSGTTQNFTSNQINQPLNITNSTLEASTLVNSNLGQNFAGGIYFYNSAITPMTVNISGKKITSTATSTSSSGPGSTTADGIGVARATTMTINISNNDISAQATSSGIAPNANGLFALLTTPNSTTFNMPSGSLTATASGGTAEKCKGNANYSNVSGSIATCVP